MEEKHAVCEYHPNGMTWTPENTLIPDCRFVRTSTKIH
jgi:hypothetical protein